MANQRLHDEFPLLVRCESSDTVVFVACPRGGRYGDVRKTLAGLLQRPFATTHIAPFVTSNTESSPPPPPPSQVPPSQPSESLSLEQKEHWEESEEEEQQQLHNTKIIPFNDAAEVSYSKEMPIIRAQILSLNEHGV